MIYFVHLLLLVVVDVGYAAARQIIKLLARTYADVMTSEGKMFGCERYASVNVGRCFQW